MKDGFGHKFIEGRHVGPSRGLRYSGYCFDY